MSHGRECRVLLGGDGTGCYRWEAAYLKPSGHRSQWPVMGMSDRVWGPCAQRSRGG